MKLTGDTFTSLLLLSLPFICSGCAVAIPAGVIGTGILIAEERSIGRVIDDHVIVAKIKSAFLAQDAKHLLTNVSVNSVEGRVLLTGPVIDEERAEQAARIAWTVPGVAKVMNELIISDEQGGDHVSDAWINSQIRGKFMLEKQLYSANYTIEVDHEVVFLLGVANSEQELEKALDLASSVTGVKRVVNYVVLKNDPRRIPKQ